MEMEIGKNLKKLLIQNDEKSRPLFWKYIFFFTVVV